MGTGRKVALGIAVGAALGVAVGTRRQLSALVGRALTGRSGVPVSSGAAAAFPDKELIRACVHCGLCLPYCPTYRALGLEGDSPRGRIYQMKLVVEGKIDPGEPEFRLHMFRCLDCRACETACPSGVQYGRLIEAARSLLPPASTAESLARRAILGTALDSPAALAVVGLASRVYQRTGLQRAVRSAGVLRLAPPLQRMDSMLPSLRGALLTGTLPEYTPAQGQPRFRVAMLRGCVAAQFFPQTNYATIAVLATNGCDVLVPPDQGCCGALQNHSGDRETARRLARRNIDVFLPLHPDYVVVNSAGCGSMMKEYGDLLADDPAYAAWAKEFSAKVRDVTELLAALPLRAPQRPLRRTITYQDACHLGHGQKIREAPRQVLRAIPGLELRELKESDWCCGSAGIYNVTQPELSEQILGWKMANVAATGADTITAANPGCLIQLEHGLRERGLHVKTAHPVDLLAEAYGFDLTRPEAALDESHL
ncbi:MAG: heterodisulfide reductase-related iron-sulfur binding cluster [Chloroflexi bacterium]|nr:heterodisulfide reductase-related iron-sulfur binding cluster [Chloroflexota bacterium]